MWRVLHGCGTGVVIAEGLVGRDARCGGPQGRIVWIGVRGISRGIRRNGGGVWVSARVANRCEAHLKRRTLTKRARRIRCRIGVPKKVPGAGQVLGVFQDTPPNSLRGPQSWRLVMAVLNRARVPPAVEGSSRCPAKLVHTPGFLCPPDKKELTHPQEGRFQVVCAMLSSCSIFSVGVAQSSTRRGRC